jgi:mRNA interferase RelE/StbE
VTPYSLEISSAAEKELDRLPKEVARRIALAIDDLQSDPRPQGVLKLKGSRSKYRIRVGQYRVLYQVDDKVQLVTVVRIRHRKDAYQ